jgi:hypothetical protein
VPSSPVQPPPLLFNVPPPPLMRPLLPPPQSAAVLTMPPFGLPPPNVPPPLISPQMGLPPAMTLPVPHRLPPGPNMMGRPARPDLSRGLLEPRLRQGMPPGMVPGGPRPGMPPSALLGPNGSQGLIGQGPQPLLGRGGLLAQGPPQPLLQQGGMMSQSPQPLLGPLPGSNLLGQSVNLPQFDIGQILSAIRSSSTAAAPPNSASAE